MADLGNLWFSLGLDDTKFEKQWEKALQKYQNTAKINVDFKISDQAIAELKRFKDSGFSTQEAKTYAQMAKSVMDVAIAQEKYNRELAKSKALNTESAARISRQDSEAIARNNARNAESLARQELIRGRINNLDRQAVSTNKKLTTHYRDQALWVQNLMTFASNYFSLYAVKNFVAELANVTGEFEKQRVTLQAMVGETEGLEIFGKMKELAVVSPFEFKDLASYAKQLAAFSVPYEELYDTTKRLADVSAGLGVDMSRIILAYGQIRSAGVLKGTELRQLTEAGVPILEKLADKFEKLEGRAVSIGDVFGKISKKMVSFEMVNDIFKEMTSEGGKFYNMQEIQADTLAGKISNLKDAYSIMLSTIGNRTETELKGGVDILYDLMKNWEVLGRVVLTVFNSFAGFQLGKVFEHLAGSVSKFASKFKDLYEAASESKSVISSFISALKGAGGWGTILAIFAGIATAIWQCYRAANMYRKEMEGIIGGHSIELEKETRDFRELAKAIDSATKGSQNRRDAIDEFNSRYGSYLQNMLTEASTANELAIAYNNVAEAIKNKYKQEAKSKAEAKVEEEYGSKIRDRLVNLQTELTNRGLSGRETEDILILLREYYAKGGAKAEEIVKIITNRIGEELYKKTIGARPNDTLQQSLMVHLRHDIQSYEKAMQEVKNMIDGRFGDAAYSTKEEAEFVSRVEEYYKRELEALRGQGLLADEFEKQAKKLQSLKLQELSEWYGSKGLTEIADDYLRQWEALNTITTGWRKEIAELTATFNDERKGIKIPTFLNPQENEVWLDYVKRIQEEYKRLKEAIDNIGSDPDKDLPDLKAQLDVVKAIADAYKFPLDAKGENKSAQLLQNYRNKFDKFVSEIQLKASELNTSLSSISFKDIDADSISSKLYEINSEFEKGAVEIEKYKEKVLEAWKGVLQAKARSEGRVFSGDVTFDMLPKEAQQVISVYNQLIAKKKEYDEALLNKSVIDKYASLAEREREILKTASAEFRIGYGKEGFDIEQWEKNLKEAIARLYEELDPIVKKAFGSIKYETGEGILNSIQILQNKVNSGQLSEDDTERYIDRIQELKKAYQDLGKVGITTNISGLVAKRDELKLLEEQIDATIDSEAKIKLLSLYNQKKTDYNLSIAATGADMFAKGLSRAAEAMSELAEATDDAELAATAQQLESFGNTLSSVIQGFATGGPIMGLISGVMSIISNSINSIVKARIYNEQFTQSVTDYTNAIKNLKLQLNENDYDAIFGVNSLRKVNDAIQKAKNSLDAYNSELNKKVSKPKWVNQNDKAFGKYLSELDAYERGLTEIEAIQIKTRERSGFAEFWGFRDEYKSLKDFVSDLWGEDGVFNIANAEKFLEASGDILNESQRKIIQNAIDLYKTYEENMEVINEHLSDIFSDTASTIAERMMDSFAQTGDAATELGDLVSGVAKQMAKDLIQSLLVDQYLAPVMDRIKSLYNPQDKAYEQDATLRTQKAIVAMQDAISAAGQAVPEVNRLLEAIQAMGVDLSTDSENASQVLSGLTEDQQNLLVSYINAIRADVSMNKGMLTSIVNSVGTINNNIATAIVIWTQIEANTHRSADGVDRIIGFFESVMGPYDGGAGQAFQVNIA